MALSEFKTFSVIFSVWVRVVCVRISTAGTTCDFYVNKISIFQYMANRIFSGEIFKVSKFFFDKFSTYLDLFLALNLFPKASFPKIGPVVHNIIFVIGKFAFSSNKY